MSSSYFLPWLLPWFAAWARHMPLIEDIVTQLRKIGAYAIADVGSNREGKMYYQYVPAKYDSQPPSDLIRLAGIASSIVAIDYPNGPSITAGVAPARVNALNGGAVRRFTGAAFQPLLDRCERRLHAASP